MQRFLRFLNLLWSGRCWLTTLFFLVVVGFVDHNSFLNLFFLLQKNSELKEEIAYYEQQYAEDSKALRLLNTSAEAVEKVARVNLLMKNDNEDVYVVVEE